MRSGTYNCRIVVAKNKEIKLGWVHKFYKDEIKDPPESVRKELAKKLGIKIA